ncbi:MAG: hypothetical protein PHG05_00055 [Candidatus Nanoarchaeia archaeon]|nr:hypothetical protein [Candidatus Nanoarchaeia archaeon]
MEASQFYILLSIIILLIIAIFAFFIRKDKKEKKLTPLAGVAFAFVLAGIIFGDSRLVSYSLMGIGVLLAIIDMIRKLKKR